MEKTMTLGTMSNLLETTYEKAINGLPGMKSAYELAEDYGKKHDDINKSVNELINWQITKCGTSGFLSGIGGIITLPVAVPANVASVVYIQVRMIAAIAHMAGYDLKDDRVQSLVYVCMCGNGAKDILKVSGIKIGETLAKGMINKIPRAVIGKINQKVGMRLVTKFGQKGVINLGKMVPLVGGVIGAGFDVASTQTVGRVAKKTFLGDVG